MGQTRPVRGSGRAARRSYTTWRMGTSRRRPDLVRSSRMTPRLRSMRSQLAARTSSWRIPVSSATVTMASRCAFWDFADAASSRASSSGSSQRTRPSGSFSSVMTGIFGSTSQVRWAVRRRLRSSASGRLMLAAGGGAAVLVLPPDGARREALLLVLGDLVGRDVPEPRARAEMGLQVPGHPLVLGVRALAGRRLEVSREGLLEDYVLVAHGRGGGAERRRDLGGVRERLLLGVEDRPGPCRLGAGRVPAVDFPLPPVLAEADDDQALGLHRRVPPGRLGRSASIAITCAARRPTVCLRVSHFLTVTTCTPTRSANFDCVRPSRLRRALTWVGVMGRMVARHYLGVNRVLPGPLPERGDRNDPLPRPQLAAGEPPGPEQLAHLRRFHLPQPRQPVDGEHLGVREIVGPGLGPPRGLQGGQAGL